MLENKLLRLHFLNVKHGDATIIEFPDFGSANTAHFGVVDFGPRGGDERQYLTEYLNALIDLRKNDEEPFDYKIDFACVTHPHDDHYGGANPFFEQFSSQTSSARNKIQNFWDCGFRVNDDTYNALLLNILQNKFLTFTRVSAGSEYYFGNTLVQVLAPSVDLRNRFDTYGVKKNDGSIVLRIKFNKANVILAGDAEYASWGKITEEYPRKEAINYYSDALGFAERADTPDQLRCMLLRMSHHGSKRGSSFEYLERLAPSKVVISAGNDDWYAANKPANWSNKFPDQLVIDMMDVLAKPVRAYENDIFITGDRGNLIFKFTGSAYFKKIKWFDTYPGDQTFEDDLAEAWED